MDMDRESVILVRKSQFERLLFLKNPDDSLFPWTSSTTLNTFKSPSLLKKPKILHRANITFICRKVFLLKCVALLYVFGGCRCEWSSAWDFLLHSLLCWLKNSSLKPKKLLRSHFYLCLERQVNRREIMIQVLVRLYDGLGEVFFQRYIFEISNNFLPGVEAAVSEVDISDLSLEVGVLTWSVVVLLKVYNIILMIFDISRSR